jgi:DNA-binding transcriptional MocR family regulator
MHASEIRELLKLLEQPDIISFAGGIPDPALFPHERIGAALAAIMADPVRAGEALQYSTTEGHPPLRRWIVRHMARLGVACGIENVVVTTGSQQAVDLLAKLLLEPGDTAVVAKPSYLGALQAFDAYQAGYLDLGAFMDSSPGAAAGLTGGRLAFGYVVTEHANPSGETFPLRDRERLLDGAAAAGMPIIEDAAYEALRYDGERLPSLLALDVARRGHIDSSRVAYCGSFSKVIAPGLRVGWLCAARELTGRVVLAKQASDLHSPSLSQMVLGDVLDDCYDGQVALLVGSYRERRDAMLEALGRHMPSGVGWSAPQGGMFVWVTLPEGVDTSALLARSIREERVAFVPGRAFFFDGGGGNTLRLNFSLQRPEAIEHGIARLGRLLRRTA